MSVLTEDQQASIIEEAMVHIKEAVIDSATRQATYTASDAIQREVNEVVSTFMREHIAPDITAALLGSKETIVKAAVLSAESMAENLAKAMTASLAENLADSYSRNKIIEALFD